MGLSQSARKSGLVVAILAFATGHAAADWPSARHDSRRTGVAGGASNLESPVPYWRYYLGGTVDDTGAIGMDVDLDGIGDVVFATGGRLHAVRVGGGSLWQTPPRGFSALVGSADLNGDGKLELLARTGSQLVVVDPTTGAAHWTEPPEDLGTLGGVRIGDFDGDGAQDVLVQECGCCAVNNGAAGMAYSFASGLAAPKKLWDLPSVTCGGSNSTTLFLGPTGAPRLLFATLNGFQVLEPSTGAIIANTPVGWSGAQLSRCTAFELDQSPGDEMLCTLSTADYAAGAGHKAFLLQYVEAVPKLEVKWVTDVGQLDARVTTGPGMVSDLDVDGLLEVVVGGADASSASVTTVLDAKTGAPLTSATERLVACAGIGPGKSTDVITEVPAGLKGSVFTRVPAPKLTHRWTLAGRRAFTQTDFGLAALGTQSAKLVAADMDGDSVPDLATATQSLGDLVAFAVAGSSPVAVGNYAAPAGSDLLRVWLMPPLDRPYPQFAVARSDGKFSALDATLKPTAAAIGFGGYFASGGYGTLAQVPVVAAFVSQAQSVVVPDSRGALVRLDAAGAGLAVPPTPVWTRLRSVAPAIASHGAEKIIACRSITEPVTSPPSYEIRSMNSSGITMWSQPIERTPLNDLMLAQIDSDEFPDVVVQWGSESDTVLHTRVLSGKTGATLWDQALNPGPTRHPAGVAATDWNSDGRTDIVFQHYGTRVLSGIGGVTLATGGPTAEYFMTTLLDVNGDGSEDVVYQGGFHPNQVWLHDLSTSLWVGATTDRPFSYGSVVSCPGGGPMLVEGASAVPGQLRFTKVGGPSAGSSQTLYLAGGKSFQTKAAATAAGEWLGQLSSTAAHQNMSGTGHPSAVVGSSDGWLYAVDVCSAKLEFSFDFGWPVGAAVFGDTDGDGNDDLVVSVADGYLYDLRQAALNTPSFVWDTDPAHGVDNQDVDDVESESTLSAKWGQVDGATSYRIAILSQATGAVVLDWKDVGLSLNTAEAGLPLAEGESYRFAVRAMKGELRSPDVLSDGVTVHFPVGADGGADAVADGPEGAPDADASTDGGNASPAAGAGEILSGRACTCGTVAPAESAGSLGRCIAFLLVLAQVARRRKRHP